MESDEDKDTFHVPNQPNLGAGGKREGSGRKKLYGDGGYKRVKDLLWKNITVHTHVHDEGSDMASKKTQILRRIFRT